jgi:hypothetical protein
MLTGHTDLGRGSKARVQLYGCSVSDSVVCKICLSLWPDFDFRCVLDPLILPPWGFRRNYHLEETFA